MGEYSLYKTFANKYRTSPTKVIKRLKKGKDIVITAMNKSGPKDHRLVKTTDFKPTTGSRKAKVDNYPNLKPYMGWSELETRVNANYCEICGRFDGYFEVHHVKKVKDLKDGKQSWERYMIARRRKTLVLCIECHDLLHAGTLPDWRFMDDRAESVVH